MGDNDRLRRIQHTHIDIEYTEGAKETLSGGPL